MSLLGVIGVTLLKLSLNVTVPRQWTLQQSVTDAYLTFEKSAAQRLPFDELTGDSSLWPSHPTIATTTVELGKLPGGTPINGRVSRTRFADPNNLPKPLPTAAQIEDMDDGDAKTELLNRLKNNPAAMEVWKFQSVIRYELGGRTYLKSRTVVRSQ
jgi:hypothetical protein